VGDSFVSSSWTRGRFDGPGVHAGEAWKVLATTGGFGKRWDLLEGEFEPNGDGLGLDRS